MAFLRLIPALFLGFVLVFPGTLLAQWRDNFSDGDFANNPAWGGDNNSFWVENQVLRSKDSTLNSSFYLSTPSSIALSASWECWVNLRFSTSGSNYTDFWLMSNNANLRDATEGYFIRLGDTPDEISLHRKNGATSTKIIDGRDGVVRSSNNNVFRVKATRSASGDWQLLRDSTGTGNNYVSEGTINDLTYTTSTHGGILVRQSTASFFSKHFFDDFVVEAIVPDITPPTATAASSLSANTLEVLFSEPVTETTAANTANYLVNNGIGTPSSVTFNVSTPARAVLNFAGNFQSGQNYQISVSGISDLEGNVMTTPSVLNFSFEIPDQPGFREIVINEIMANERPKVGLPLCEWIELHNPTNRSFQLAGYTIWDAASTTGSVIGNYLLGPGEYVLLARVANLDSFPSVANKVACNIPSLNNSGDDVILRNPSGTVIDQLTYSDTWYRDPVKRNGGWTLELINPVSPCPSGSDNWIASNNLLGGTPGRQNSVYSTLPDQTPPTLSSWNLVTTSTINLVFSKFMDSVSLRRILNYSLAGNSVSLATTEFPFNRVLITLNTPLQVGTITQFSIQNLRDCAGNNLPLTNISIGIGAEPLPGDLTINELYPDEDPSNGLPGFEFIEVHNKSNRLLSLNDWSIADPGARGFFPRGTIIYPDSFILVVPANAVTAYNIYGPTTVLSRWPSLNNTSDTISLINPDGSSAQTLTYDLSWYRDNVKANGGWTLEQINPISACPPGSINWIASTAPIGGTPGRKNSVYSTSPDQTVPTISSWSLVNNNSIVILFSKFMDSVSLRQTANYALAGYTITTATAVFPFNRVTITLTAPFQVGTFSQLSVRNLRDCAGNNLNLTNLSIGVGAAPQPGDLTINELYPDESPSIGLPGHEFIEVYNKSNRLLSLTGWSIADPGSQGFFPDGTIIYPDSFLIVAPTNGVAAYSVYAPTTTLSRWPSLNNSEDTISLINPNGVSVQTLVYDLSWYRDNAKANGGWTLEQINPVTTCPPGPSNWIASVALLGGTPGRRNSVYSTAPDATRPEFVLFRFVSPTAMQITFSKGMDSLSLATIANYTVQGLTITSAVPFNFFQGVTLNFSTPLDSGRAYNLILRTNLKDCSGNRLPFTTFAFGIGASPQPGQLVINELFADETPSNGLPASEFVELHNLSDKILDLTGCTFSSSASRGKIPDNTTIGPGEYLILAGSSAAANYQDFGKTVAVVSMPTLNNTGMQVFLRNKDNVLLHTVNYKLSWYRDLTKVFGGWSLEMIDPLYYCTGALNWTASEAEIGGTPGVRNSVAASNPDLMPPGLQKAAFIDSVTVLLYISEDLDSLQAMNSATYTVEPNVQVTAVSLEAGRFDRVYLKLNTEALFNTTYTVKVNNLQDCSGNVQAQEQQATFVRAHRPEVGDLVINELLSDPQTGGVDFVEIYNNSNKAIDLKGCKLANGRGAVEEISPEPLVMNPNGYVLFTPNAELTLRDYPNARKENFFVVSSFPAFNIDSGTVRIMKPNDETLDRFFFNEKLHFRLIDNTKGISLERIAPTLPTNSADNWKSASSAVGFATPGYLNSQDFGLEPGTDELEIKPAVFSPDEDGDRDFTFITINVAEPGFVANMWIFDSRGRIVKTMLQNELLGATSSLQWDGLRDDNTKAPIGAYMVMAELYNLEGKKKVVKKPVAIASYFR